MTPALPRLIIGLSMFLTLLTPLSAVDSVNVDPATTYQTIEAWGSSESDWIAEREPASLRQHFLEAMVNDLGLTRSRIQGGGGNFWDGPGKELLNDDGDPYTMDIARFNLGTFDQGCTRVYVPMKQLVEARGEVFTSYFTSSMYDTGSSGGAPAWQLNSPAEHAEFLSAHLLRLRDTHGITPTYTTILNEPTYNNTFTWAITGNMIKTVGPHLQSLGLPTKIQFPEAMKPQSAMNAITTWQNDPEIWPHVGMLSYHVYGTEDPYRDEIRAFGEAKGIRRAQTEDNALTVDDIYDDLTKAGVSVWEMYELWSRGLAPTQHWFKRTAYFWQARQVMNYVRPGSVRVGATSTTTSVRPLAFMRNGLPTVVLWNTTGGGARTMDITGLVPGSYQVSRTLNSGAYLEMGVFTASAAGVLSGMAVPSGCVLTIHPHAGNRPPTMVDWRSTPEYLTSPASSLTLSASAQDPELSAVTYAWSVQSKPAGATVTLGTPNAATTTASGLGVVGVYVFKLTVGDGANSLVRTVEVPVYAANQPPVPFAIHNRNPVTVTLPVAKTELRGGARDPEGDTLTWQWSVVSQPAGANAVLATPAARDSTVSGMTVSGNYVFRLNISDGTNTVPADLTVPVYPANQAPVVSAATASPSALTLPISSAMLSGTSSDPDAAAMAPWRAGGDVLTHWWSVQSAPAGARPVFAKPGLKNTTVSGLTVAGTYVFKLTAIDRTLMASRTVTVTVAPGAVNAAPVITTPSPAPLAVLEDASGALNLTATDADGDPLSWSVLTPGSKGVLTVSSLGSTSTATYTPGANQVGSDSVVVQVSDGRGGSDTVALAVTITPVNDAPSFTVGGNVSVVVGSGAANQSGWATGISAGPADELGQSLAFLVSSSNPALFSVQPALAADGTLTFTPAPAASGTATLSLRLQDGGGTANGGVDQSPLQTATITVVPATAPTGLWLEAESADTLSAPLAILADPAAAGGEYIANLAAGDSYAQPPATGHAVYTFDLSQTGSYVIWGRIIMPSTSKDSFWVRVDNGPWTIWSGMVTKTWTWKEFHIAGVTTLYDLAAGRHTLTIAYREDGAKLDALYIASDGSVPTGSSPPQPTGGG
ncbi:MAG: Ig-like domain-containing protein [Planctomycetota bacterium]